MDGGSLNGWIELAPARLQTDAGQRFEIAVNIHASSHALVSSDVYILYDKNHLVPQLPPENKGYFSSISARIIEPGRIYISGINTDTRTSSGDGQMAKLAFTSLKPGETTIIIECLTNAKLTTQLISASNENTNVIDCIHTGQSRMNLFVAVPPNNTSVLGTQSTRQNEWHSLLPYFILACLIAAGIFRFTWGNNYADEFRNTSDDLS